MKADQEKRALEALQARLLTQRWELRRGQDPVEILSRAEPEAHGSLCLNF